MGGQVYKFLIKNHIILLYNKTLKDDKMTEEKKPVSGFPPKGAYLVINSQVFPIKQELVKIGRKLDNDLVIQEPLVSRYHAEIRLEDEKFHLHDLESTGGTFLNQKKIASSVLYSGDIILLANVPVMFIDDSTNLIVPAEETTGHLE
jgi:pSer/pThr/pTyr-binding forkhead associated (FHA) protein